MANVRSIGVLCTASSHCSIELLTVILTISAIISVIHEHHPKDLVLYYCLPATIWYIVVRKYNNLNMIITR